MIRGRKGEPWRTNTVHLTNYENAQQRHQLGQQKAALLRRSAFCCRLWRTLGVLEIMKRYGSANSTFCAQAWARLSRCLRPPGFAAVHTSRCPLSRSVGVVVPASADLPPGSSGQRSVRFASFTSSRRPVSLATAMPNPAVKRDWPSAASIGSSCALGSSPSWGALRPAPYLQRWRS